MITWLFAAAVLGPLAVWIGRRLRQQDQEAGREYSALWPDRE